MITEATMVTPNGTGSGASGTALVDIGAVTDITVTNPGTGYLTVGMRKFIDDLPGLHAIPISFSRRCLSRQSSSTLTKSWR